MSNANTKGCRKDLDLAAKCIISYMYDERLQNLRFKAKMVLGTKEVRINGQEASVEIAAVIVLSPTPQVQ